jgi:hypothetical protein
MSVPYVCLALEPTLDPYISVVPPPCNHYALSQPK